jgi:hypothetical protein
MAVQFPNFLQAQILKPDYSGIGDALQNVLAGYEGSQRPMQLKQEAQAREFENILKGVQAKYAEPTAQAHLKQLQMTMQKAQQEAAQEEMFRKLLSGSAPAATSQNIMGQQGGGAPDLGAAYKPGEGMPLFANQESQAPNMQSIPSAPKPTPGINGAPTQVLSAGSPNLYHVDELYETNPLSRSFLEKKGFKKTQVVKFDPKTGASTLITTWPSQKVTVQTLGGMGGAVGGGDDSMALTTAGKTQKQNMIGSVTTAIPLLDKLAKFNTPVGGFGWTNANNAAQYESLTNQLSDQLMTALNLPKTNESLALVKTMTKRHTLESDRAYHKRIKDLKDDLISRKKYAQGALKGGVKLKDEVTVTEDDPLGLF